MSCKNLPESTTTEEQLVSTQCKETVIEAEMSLSNDPQEVIRNKTQKHIYQIISEYCAKFREYSEQQIQQFIERNKSEIEEFIDDCVIGFMDGFQYEDVDEDETGMHKYEDVDEVGIHKYAVIRDLLYDLNYE
jgi:hypothetical protein